MPNETFDINDFNEWVEEMEENGETGPFTPEAFEDWMSSQEEARFEAWIGY